VIMSEFKNHTFTASHTPQEVHTSRAGHDRRDDYERILHLSVCLQESAQPQIPQSIHRFADGVRSTLCTQGVQQRITPSRSLPHTSPSTLPNDSGPVYIWSVRQFFLP